jgi:hypothetical protein
MYMLDLSGVLESEDIVLSKIGKWQDYWYRPSITDSSQRRVESGYLDSDSEIVKKPIGNGRALIHAALRSQNIDFMIRDLSKPEPPANSGWVRRQLYQSTPLTHTETLAQKRLPSPEHSAEVQLEEPED